MNEMVSKNGRCLSFAVLPGCVSLFLIAWATMVGVALSFGLLFFCLSFPLIAVVWGKAALRFAVPRTTSAEEPRAFEFELEFSLGVCLLSLALLAMAYCAPGNIAWHYAALCMGAMAMGWIMRPHLFPAPHKLPLRIFVLLFSLAGISILYYYTLSFYTLGAEEVRFTAYVDVFLHANTLSMFSTNPEAFVNRYLLGADHSFYHFSSYLIPAAFHRLSGASTIETAACLWAPLGYLTMTMAAFATGRRSWGPVAGLAAVWVLLALPDGSVLPTSHSHLSFFTYARISPAMPYAIAQALVAFCVLQMGLEKQGKRLLVLAGILSLSVLVVKAHVALFFFPVAVGYAVLAYPGCTWKQRMGAMGALTILGVATLLAGFALKPELGDLGEPGVVPYMAYLFKTARLYDPLFIHLKQLEPETLRTFLGLPAAVVATFGLLLPWYVAILIGKLCVRKLDLNDLLPGVFIALYVLTMALWPLYKDGPSFEFQHRPHVFVYAWMAIYCAGQSAAFLPRFGAFPASAWIKAGAILVLMVSLLVPWVTKDHYQHRCHATRMRGNYAIPRGLWECARFIRDHAETNDVHVTSSQDPMGKVTGITERPALISYTIQTNKTLDTREVFARNVAIHEALRAATSLETLQNTAQEHGVRWYLLEPDGLEVAWPQSVLDQPAYSSNGYGVYDLHNLVQPHIAP